MNSCKKIKNDIVDCIHNSECFLEGNTFGECLKNKNSNISENCKKLIYTYYLCKRGQVYIYYF